MQNNNSEEFAQPMQLVIASRNVHKIREFKTILHQLLPNLDLLSLLDFPDYTAPAEEGSSFKEIAETKAIDAAKKLNHWTMADDSGLVIPSLNGEPGIFSSRYAGENATDRDNRKKLLEKMSNFEEKDRFAYFECCIAIAAPDELKKSACASCEGIITDKEKGGSGFGYDPLFIKHEYSKTFAELEESVKNRISHRRKAIDKVINTLESLVK